MGFRLSELELALGRELGGDPDLWFSRIQFDSRRELGGSLFFALPGLRTDGRRFVAQALAGGARQAVVASLVPGADPDRQIVVDEPKAALARLATLLRRRRSPRAVIGVTGSNGKTTTKDMVAAALAPVGSVQKSQASFNAEIGVPVTIADLEPGVDFAVVELGAQEVGEITRYCRIADPTDAVITNIGHAHIGLFGSRANIAFAKGELGAWLRPAGNLVLNADDPFAPRLAGRTRARIRWISERDADAAVHVAARPTGVGMCFSLSAPSGCADVELPTLSSKVGLACAAAAAIADCLGVHIHDAAAGMSEVALAPRRMQVRCREPYLVIDDSYNANLESGIAALEALFAAEIAGRRAAVLGEMLELGRFAAQSHHDLGARATGLALLVTIGKNARLTGQAARAAGLPAESWLHVEADIEDAKSIAAAASGVEQVLRDWLRPGDGLLIKGSNALKLSQIAERVATPESGAR